MTPSGLNINVTSRKRKFADQDLSQNSRETKTAYKSADWTNHFKEIRYIVKENIQQYWEI